MRIKTKHAGEVDISEKQIVTFHNGLYGFGNMRQFALLEEPTAPPFYQLQSLEDVNLSFILVEPKFVEGEYKPTLMGDDLEQLELAHITDEKAIVFLIVTIPHDESALTVNLAGPLVINKETRCARQCITSGDEWGTKHQLTSTHEEQEQC